MKSDDDDYNDDDDDDGGIKAKRTVGGARSRLSLSESEYKAKALSAFPVWGPLHARQGRRGPRSIDAACLPVLLLLLPPLYILHPLLPAHARFLYAKGPTYSPAEAPFEKFNVKL